MEKGSWNAAPGCSVTVELLKVFHITHVQIKICLFLRPLYLGNTSHGVLVKRLTVLLEN